MRRLVAFLTLLLLMAVGPWRVNAQPAGGDVLLRLVRQTPWNDPEHTRLTVQVRAVNASEETLDDLSLGVTIETPVGSRSEYERSLESDTGEVLSATSALVTGPLDPGTDREVGLPPIDLAVLAERDETAIYPMKVELRSHDQPVATLRSPVVFLAQNPPDQPLDLTWTFVLSAPIVYEPDGTFRTPWLERQIAHGGPLRAEAEALAKLAARPASAPFDAVVAPQLVDQLIRMRSGYLLRIGDETRRVEAGRGSSAAAAQVLRDLKVMAASSSVELSAMPYASPSLPAMIRGGLSGDITQQLRLGRADVASALGKDPVSAVLRPPGSRLDQGSLFELHRRGIRLLLVDKDAVAQKPQPNGFAQPAVAPLSVGPTLDAIAPDDGVQRILESQLPNQDPHLAVQTLLGELAAIWLEQPSVSRGVGAIFSERTRAPGYFYGPFVQAVDGAPWLRTIKASVMPRLHPPADTGPVELIATRGPTFSPEYLSDLGGARERISTYRSLFTEQRDLPDNLAKLVLVAEAGQFASREDLGEAFLQDVSRRLAGQFKRVAPDTSSTVTLTSRSGNVYVPVQNLTAQQVRVRVELQSNRLSFANGASRVVSIPGGGGVTLAFGVQARTTGRFPVVVRVLTPDGRTELSRGRLVVRSTAYNRIALVLTIGAGLFLLALWARRLLPWAKR
ncbi:MAG: DUF6049 family protein [Actinomycetota bacterium]